MAFRGYISLRHYLWYGLILPAATGGWHYLLLVLVGLSFAVFLSFWGYGWGDTRWFFWDSWFAR